MSKANYCQASGQGRIKKFYLSRARRLEHRLVSLDLTVLPIILSSFTIIFVFILTAPSSSYGRNLKVEVGFSPGVQDFKSINIIFIFKLLFIN